MTRDKNVIYGYFTVRTEQGHGYVCVRVDRPPLGEKGSYRASFAFCSPKDAPKERHMLNKHFRAVSRRIADSRMAAPAVMVRRGREIVNHIEFDFDMTGKTLPDLVDVGLRRAYGMGLTPEWMDQAVYEYGLM